MSCYSTIGNRMDIIKLQFSNPCKQQHTSGVTLMAIYRQTLPFYCVAQSQKAVAAYLKSKQLLPFGFAEQYCKR